LAEPDRIITGQTPLPTPGEVRLWWDRFGMLENIRQHSEVVRRVAMKLTAWLAQAGVHLRPEAVEVGALAHDIAKTSCLGTDKMHAQEGEKIVADLGYPELAKLVLYHVTLPPGHPLDEIMVVNYADKRVTHTEVVDLGERYAYILDRYGKGDPARIARIEKGRENLFQVEKLIFSRIDHGHTPEEIKRI
jgi:hypothetical protein